jgi:hypothetical protein
VKKRFSEEQIIGFLRESVELAILQWVHWFNHIRLLKPIGGIFHRQKLRQTTGGNSYNNPSQPQQLKLTCLLETRGRSVNMSLRKITKNRGSFPSDEALLKLFYLALNNIAKRWTMPVQNWKPVLNRFTIQFGERMPAN